MDLWLEPSAGAGVFLNRLPSPNLGLDISPDGDNIIQQDYLTYCPPPHTKIGVVGNPPFGKNSSLAIKFFNHSASFASLIAFILPKTFRKESIINKLNLMWVREIELELPKNSFHLFDDLGRIKEYDVPCVWQVWIPGKRDKIKTATSHEDWQWSSKQNATYAIRRVGALAGKCFSEFSNYAESSHYFITCTEEVYLKLNSLFAEFQLAAKNTAGNPSLSKSEIVKLYSA